MKKNNETWVTRSNINSIDFSDFNSEIFNKRFSARGYCSGFIGIDFANYSLNLENTTKLSVQFRYCKNLHLIKFPKELTSLTLWTCSSDKIESIEEIEKLNVFEYDSTLLSEFLHSIKHIKIEDLNFRKCLIDDINFLSESKIRVITINLSKLISFNCIDKLNVKFLLIERGNDIVSIESIENIQYNLYYSYNPIFEDWDLENKVQRNVHINEQFFYSDGVLTITKYEDLGKVIEEIDTSKIIEVYDGIHFTNLDFAIDEFKFENKNKHKNLQFDNCKNLHLFEKINKYRFIEILSGCTGKFKKNLRFNSVKILNHPKGELEKTIDIFKNVKIHYLDICTNRIENFTMLQKLNYEYGEICLLNKVNSFDGIHDMKYNTNIEIELHRPYDKNLKKLPKCIGFCQL